MDQVLSLGKPLPSARKARGAGVTLPVRAAARPGKAVKLAQRDAERTRQKILAAASDEFARKGFAGARVDVIARTSGANKRMIYYYFTSKEGLYSAVLERAYEDMRASE